MHAVSQAETANDFCGDDCEETGGSFCKPAQDLPNDLVVPGV
jgi:hypothetical protein